MTAMLETPSRIWRRIEAVEDQDMPSLPSVPAFEDSADGESLTSQVLQDSEGHTNGDDDFSVISSPKQSTPASSQYASTIRALSNTVTTVRFANSTSSRKSSLGLAASRSPALRNSPRSGFSTARMVSLPRVNVDGAATGHPGSEHSDIDEDSVPDIYLPPPEVEDEVSITDALQSVSRSNSPPPFAVDAFEEDGTPKKNYDYSVSLRSEPKPSPFNKFQNVAIRKIAGRTRTPSLTRTLSSQTSSPTNSTPSSSRSVPSPRSHSASPVSATRIPLPHSASGSPVNRNQFTVNESVDSEHDPSSVAGVDSMDITDVHSSSPVKTDTDIGSADATEVTKKPGTYMEEPEATFSSDEAPTPYSNKHDSGGQYPSPSGSLGFTPTPAFPRPRARFNLPLQSNEIPSTPAQNEGRHEQDYDDLMTPHTRRRSFLLSVINSTARPRLKVGTPHPRNLPTPGMASIVESTPGPSNESGSVSLRTVLAGVTPRPPMHTRRRMSHTPARTYALSPVGSDAESAAPYDGDDRVSVISTTSSQDLTAHPRANASFDPAMGFGAGATGHGVGRFNAGKLNNYLHVLNRRLQEENVTLLERVRNLEEQLHEESSPASASNRRLSAGSATNRRLSAGTVLNDVAEDPAAERWLEERAELEEMIGSLKEEVAQQMADKEEAEDVLEKEKQERERDKERWKERMAEVEAGVSELVAQLEKKLEAAEKEAQETAANSEEQLKELDKEIECLRDERDCANDRAEKAEGALRSGKDLGGALNQANEQLAQAMSDLKGANAQIRDLEAEVMEAHTRMDELETRHKQDQEALLSIEKDYKSRDDEIAEQQDRAEELEAQLRVSDENLREAEAYIEELAENAENAAGRLETLENEIADAQNIIKKLEINELEAKQRIAQFEEEAAKAKDVNLQMEEALEEAEKKMLEDGEALISLRSELAALEREQQRTLSQNVSRSVISTGSSDPDLEALETELDEAHKEIARLNGLVAQSPARKAIDMAKDTKIEMLEREREELLERNKALRVTVNEVMTPHKIVNASGISPIHRHVLSMSIRAPRTPGGPLHELSWLNTTASDPSVAPFVAEINRLQRELDRANESIDDKIDKLEDAGLGVVGLTQKLEDAHAKITVLEDEIARVRRTEERRSRRLERMRCQKCKLKVNIRQVMHEEESFLDASKDSLPSEPPTPLTRTTETLQQNLQAVNEELANLRKQWRDEKRQLVNEKAVLQDAANRLDAQVKEEAKRLVETERNNEKKRMTAENELEHARKIIQELEGELKSERCRLRGLATQQNRMQRDRDELLSQLKRTESDMEEVKHHLHKFKQENNQLERELRENATVEQKARLLEKKVAENHRTIENLRQERSSLSNEFKDLQQQYTEASERADRLRKEYAASSSSHDQRRHQLDIHLLEIEDLKRALESRDTKMQQVEEEKDRIMAEKNDVAKTISMLEADLRRVRKDAETFRHDLKILRLEKEKVETRYKDEVTRLERSKKQTQTKLKLLKEEFEMEKELAMKAEKEVRHHVCAADDRQLSALKSQHNKECKGLIVQIRYLKAKFTREASFRNDLGYQKQYLLILLSQFEKSEQKILVSISRIGYPIALSKPRKMNKLKSVGFLLIFLSRVKRASGSWREQSASKQAVAAALEDVRRRRGVTALS